MATTSTTTGDSGDNTKGKKKSKTTLYVAGGIGLLLVVYLLMRSRSSSATTTTVGPAYTTTSGTDQQQSLDYLETQIQNLDYAVAGQYSTTGTPVTSTTAPATSVSATPGPATYDLTRGTATADDLTSHGAGLSIGHYASGTLKAKTGATFATESGEATAQSNYSSDQLSYYLSPTGTFDELPTITSFRNLESAHPGTTTYKRTPVG